VGGARRTFVPRETVRDVLADAPLDDGFAPDVDPATGATIDEL